ncbi:MAG: hypothetical protein AABW80_04345 [Nanoarchaeota archaeon]
MIKESRLQRNVSVYAVPKSVIVASNPEYRRFIQPVSQELAEEVHKEVEAIITGDYPAHKWFQEDVCHRSTGKKGLHGSSLELNVLRQGVLRQSGLYIPSIAELKYLESLGLATNSFYREAGLQIASEDDPNADLNKDLVAEATRRGWELPLVVPSYNPLGHRNGENGFEIYFLEDADLEREVLHGEEAREFLQANFNPAWIAEKGVHRLNRDDFGVWVVGWFSRSSGSDGRVDFVSGEASAKSLQDVKDKELKEKYDSQRAELQAKIGDLDLERQAESEAFLKALSE